MNGTESRAKLHARIIRKNETIDALKRQLRRFACVQVERPAYGGGFVSAYRTCLICESEWGSDAPEAHRISCDLSGVPQT